MKTAAFATASPPRCHVTKRPWCASAAFTPTPFNLQATTWDDPPPRLPPVWGCYTHRPLSSVNIAMHGFVWTATYFRGFVSLEYEVLHSLIDVSGRTGNIVLSTAPPPPPPSPSFNAPHFLYLQGHGHFASDLTICASPIRPQIFPQHSYRHNWDPGEPDPSTDACPALVLMQLLIDASGRTGGVTLRFIHPTFRPLQSPADCRGLCSKRSDLPIHAQLWFLYIAHTRVLYMTMLALRPPARAAAQEKMLNSR